MKLRVLIPLTLTLVLWSLTVNAANPGREILVSAAVHGPGQADSLWITDLYIQNLESVACTVTLYWLPRGTDNTTPLSVALEVPAYGFLVVDDVVSSVFGLDQGYGALKLVSTTDVVVTSRIYNDRGAQGTFGQGLEGIPTSFAIEEGKSTEAMGVIEDRRWRSNVGMVDVSGRGSFVEITIFGTDGTMLGSRSFELRPNEPLQVSVDSILELRAKGYVESGVIRGRVTSGKAIFYGSRVDNTSGDAMTLESWWRADTTGN